MKKYLKCVMESFICVFVQMFIFTVFRVIFQAESLQLVTITNIFTAYTSYYILSFIFRVNKKESE